MGYITYNIPNSFPGLTILNAVSAEKNPSC